MLQKVPANSSVESDRKNKIHSVSNSISAAGTMVAAELRDIRRRISQLERELVNEVTNDGSQQEAA